MKKILSVILVIVMLFTAAPVSVFAEESGAIGGQCGDTAFWSYDEETRTVTVSGTGEIWGMYQDGQFACPELAELLPYAKKLVIGEGITELGRYAFENARAVTEIDLPSTLKVIGPDAFCGNYNLKRINFSEGLETIGETAFEWCVSLEEIVLPSTVKRIEPRAFSGCFRLKNLGLNEGLEVIRYAAFEDLLSLEKLVVPSTVTECEYFFGGCNPSTTVVNRSVSAVALDLGEDFDGDFDGWGFVDNEMFRYMYVQAGDALAAKCAEYDPDWDGDDSEFFEKGVAAVNEKYGTDFATPEEIEAASEPINDSPDYMTICCYEDSAQHEYCIRTGWPHRIIGSNYDEACGKYAVDPDFGGQCGDNAYWYFDEETRTVTVSGTGAMWNTEHSPGSSEFAPIIGRWRDEAEKVVIEEGITSVGENDFCFCSRIKEVDLPSTLKEIGDCAFCCDVNLKKINFSEGLETIGESAFYCAGILEELTLPSTVRAIGEGAFADCFNLKTLTLNEGLEKIGVRAFYHPYSLTEFVIPSTVTEFDFINNIAEGPFPMSVVNLSDTFIPFEFGEDFDGNFENFEIPDFSMFCYMFVRYYGYLAQAYDEYDEDVGLDEDELMLRAVADVNEKFGTDFADRNEVENALGTITDFNDFLRISCPEDSALHEYLKEAGIPHTLTDSDFDCACGVHNVYENDYIAPTCTENGYKGGKVCLKCEKIFEVPELIPAAGHSPVTVPAVGPGCNTPGKTEEIRCEVCRQILSGSETIPPVGHKDENSDGVCDVCGEDAGTENITIIERVVNYVRGIVNSILALFKKLFAFLD